jgi:glycosyltransferase involved in cell wall biosynthesis
LTASETERIASARETGGRRLAVLHVIIMLGETNGQYNEHCLPLVGTRDLAICTYFRPQLEAPAEIAVFPGDGTLRGFFRAFGAALSSTEHDVVHVHAPQTGALVTLALALRPSRWRLRRKLVYTVQDSYHDYRTRNKLLMLPALIVSRRVIFCGRAAYESYPALWRRLVGKRHRIVQNAADFDRVDRALEGRPAGRNGNGFGVVSVGRLEEVKDPLTLLEAFRRVPGEPRLAFVGTGSLEAEVAGAVASSGLYGRVELTGLVPRDDVFARCADASLFVSASLGEGLPVAVIEAMATGCPVVLSDIPPHREVAEGLDIVPFVRTGDVEGFAQEIDRFRSMPDDERAAIGLKCSEAVRARFGLPTMHAGVERVYRELL